MAISASDILIFLSGGAGNADPNASLGGVISTTQIVDATLSNLFDPVAGVESRDGDISYRCFYVKNNHGSLTWQAVKTFILTQATDNNAVAIGLDPVGVNGTATTVVDEFTAPAGVSFSTPVTEGTALAIGDIPNGQKQAIWVRRTVTAGAVALNVDTAVVRIEGDTAA